jgi:hypothetical protein
MNLYQLMPPFGFGVFLAVRIIPAAMMWRAWASQESAGRDSRRRRSEMIAQAERLGVTLGPDWDEWNRLALDWEARQIEYAVGAKQAYRRATLRFWEPMPKPEPNMNVLPPPPFPALSE